MAPLGMCPLVQRFRSMGFFEPPFLYNNHLSAGQGFPFSSVPLSPVFRGRRRVVFFFVTFGLAPSGRFFFSASFTTGNPAGPRGSQIPIASFSVMELFRGATAGVCFDFFFRKPPFSRFCSVALRATFGCSFFLASRGPVVVCHPPNVPSFSSFLPFGCQCSTNGAHEKTDLF